LLSGKARLKGSLAEVVKLDVTCLSYSKSVIAFIEEESETGRQIVLATASHKIYADQIAKHLSLFGQVCATDCDINLSSYRKRYLLVDKFGVKGFDCM